MGSTPFSAASPPWLEHKRRRSCAPREKTGHSSGYAIKKSRLNTKNHWRILHNFLSRPAGKKEKNAETPNWWGLLVDVRTFFDEHPDGIE
jgi:hypothetical protein